MPNHLALIQQNTFILFNPYILRDTANNVYYLFRERYFAVYHRITQNLRQQMLYKVPVCTEVSDASRSSSNEMETLVNNEIERRQFHFRFP